MREHDPVPAEVAPELMPNPALMRYIFGRWVPPEPMTDDDESVPGTDFP